MAMLPAFYFPPTIVCADDNEISLKAYQSLFSTDFNCQCYKNGQEAQDFFKGYTSPLRDICYVDKVSNVAHVDTSILMAEQFNVLNMLKLAKNADKYNLVALLLSDYHMEPGINGLELCKSLKSLSADECKKILLTQSREYDTAREALNSGVINYFANKTDPVERVLKAARKIAIEFFCDLSKDLHRWLVANGCSHLIDQEFIKYFNQTAVNLCIREHYVADKNGSFLLKSADGSEYVLIVHNEQSLDGFISSFAEEDGLNVQLEAVMQRKSIPFFGINESASRHHLSNFDNYLFAADKIVGSQPYYVHLLKNTKNIIS